MIIGKIGNTDITDKDVSIGAPFTAGHYSNQLKLALLTVLTGYLEEDRIELSARHCNLISASDLSEFLSYMLNDRRAAPRNYKISLTLTPDLTPHVWRRHDTSAPCHIVSMSGGIDSTAGLLVALERNENVTPVWVGFGQKNEDRELRAAEMLCDKLGLDLRKVHINIDKYMDHEWKRWKSGIIPGRNFLFAAIASQMFNHRGGVISICAHKEEITDKNTDKSRRFFDESSKFLTQLANCSVEVSTPFIDITKPELIAYWNSNWTKKFGVRPEDTISCYFGNNCGECKACLNRAISFIAANATVENYRVNPLSNEDLLTEGYLNRFDELTEERRLDILYAMSRHQDYSDPIKEFIASQSDRYEQRIRDRQERVVSGSAVREAIYGK